MSFLLFQLACAPVGTSDDAERYDPQTSSPEMQDGNGAIWNANLQAVENASSSQIELRWNASQEDNVSLFQLEVIDELTGGLELFQIDISETTAIIDHRKSATPYLVRIEACLDEACSLRISVQDNTLNLSTQAQRWMLNGIDRETLPILIENAQIFSGMPSDPESSSLASLWSYRDKFLYAYEQSASQVWENPTASCWDSSCVTDIRQFQMTNEFLLVLDSTNAIYAEASEHTTSCPTECSATTLYASETHQLHDFFYIQAQDLLFWEGISSCEEEGIFLSQMSDIGWQNQLDADGCPKALVRGGTSPRMISTQDFSRLYFQRDGLIQFVYSKNDSSLWEQEDLARDIVLEWEDGSSVPAGTLNIQHIAFGSANEMYLSFESEENTEYPNHHLTTATLVNP